MENILDQLNKQNKIHIYSVNDSEFRKYGRVIDFPTKDFLASSCRETDIPKEGNVYVASENSFEDEKTLSQLGPYFGAMPIQIGYCNGNNSKLGAMEWHDCNEVNIGGTDAILFLGRIEDLDENHVFDTKDAKAFYLPKNQAVVVNAGTLHFAPCKVVDSGFKVIVALEEGTNLPLKEKDIEAINQSKDFVNKLLRMKNKYLICHPERKDLVEKGTKPLITGENFEIKVIE